MTYQAIKTSVMKFVRDEDGLTIVEYAVAGGLVTVGVVLVFKQLGLNVCGVITSLRDAVAGTATPFAACT